MKMVRWCWCWCLLNTRIVFLSLEIALAVGIYGILRMKTRAMWITKAYGKVNVLAISIPFSIHTSGCLVSLTRGDPCPLSLYAWENSQQSTHFALQPSNLNDNTAIQPTIQPNQFSHISCRVCEYGFVFSASVAKISWFWNIERIARVCWPVSCVYWFRNQNLKQLPFSFFTWVHL